MKKTGLLIFFIFFCFYFSFAQSWQVLDSLCYEYGEYKPDSAIVFGKKAIEECIKEKGKNSLEYAVCLDHIAWAFKSKNKFSVADSLYKQAVDICKHIDKTHTTKYIEIVSNMATMYQDNSRYSEAEKLYKEVLHINVDAPTNKDPEYASCCNNLAELYRLQGRYVEAEPLYKKAKDIFVRVYGKVHTEYSIVCNNLALLYMMQGLYEKAETLFKEVLFIRTKTVGKKHSSYASVCNNLATLYLFQKQYEKSNVLLEQAKDIYKDLFGTQHYTYFVCSNNLAVNYTKQGRYDDAERLLNEIETAILKTVGKEHIDYSAYCNNMGELFEKKGDFSKAERYYLESKEIKLNILGREYFGYANSCNNLARTYSKMGNPAKSEPLYLEVIEIKQKEIERNFANLAEGEKEKYMRTNVNEYFDGFQFFVSNYFLQKPEISIYGYELSLTTKGLILNSSEKIKNRIMGSNNAELKKLYVEWKLTKEKYNKAINLTIEQRKQKKINVDSLQNSVIEFEKQLALKSEDFAKVFSPKRVTWKDIQNRLQKHEANVEIVKYEVNEDSTGYMAYIIKKDSKYPEIVILGNGNNLENIVKGYRMAIRSKGKDDFSYNAFWKPIADKLKDIKHIYFCPDGIYHQVNVNTLQNPKTQKYVFDEVKITQITNSKDILQTKKYASKGIYLFGNPKYQLEKDAPMGNQRELEFMDFSSGITQLQGAENEVKTIDSLAKVKNYFVYLHVQEQATEEAVKSLKNPRVLHIATHGYFKRSKYQSSEQAMRSAGLLMTGVVDMDRMEIRPHDKDDGKLTAFEIMNMELDSTELVILSACETGLGEVSKEGVYGLQRAFKVAGANTIIMSLWKVDDKATQQLMQKFYYCWLIRNMDKKSAFLKAQAELRKEYKEPYYWGAFVMIE